MGRPPGPERPHRYELRLTDEERAALDALAERQGLAPPDAMRRLLVRSTGVAAPSGTAQARVLVGDCRKVLPTLPAGTFRTCVTSPPYWQRRGSGHLHAIGEEPTVEAYVAALVDVFRQVRRVLADDGTLWVSLDDSYTSGGRVRREPGRRSPPTPAGMKGKDLIGIPWMVAAALRADGWHLRSDVIVAKPSPRPESVLDRPTLGHEHLLLLSKSERYAYDRRAVPEAQTTIWEVPRNNNASGHGAPMPVDLARRCVLLSTRSGDAVLDPFGGSGTTGRVALSLGRNATLVEVKKSYAAFAARSLADRNPGSGAPIGELARLDPARARSVIRAALRGAGARVDGAAAHLRVSDTTLRRIMRDIDLKPSFKPLRA